jgi:hypothetical protein
MFCIKFVSVLTHNEAAVMVVDLHLLVQSVPITNKVLSSNPVHGEVYLIQHYVIKFVSDRGWFSPCTPVSSINKTDRHPITEILLKVALSTIMIVFNFLSAN